MPDIVRWTNTRISAIEEVTKGTPVTETAESAIFLGGDGAAFNLDRESLENPIMTGSFTKLPAAPGMDSDDMGPTIPCAMRGAGNLSKGTPEWAIFAKSLMGLEETNTDGTVDVGSTTTNIVASAGANDLAVGQQVYFPAQKEISQVRTTTTGSFTVWPALSAAPSAADIVQAGTSWMLSSTVHPAFTLYSYFNGGVNPLRLRYDGTQCINGVLNFTVGQYATMLFTSRAIKANYDYIAQAVTPEYDEVTPPLRVLGATSYSLLPAVSTGTPTTTEVILASPSFDVAIGDLLMVDVGSGAWETQPITAVSGTAGGDITLTVSPAFSAAPTTGEPVFVQRGRCAVLGNTVEVTVDLPNEAETCMNASNGKTGIHTTGRNVTFTKTPYFRSWQDFYMRDEVTRAGLQILLGEYDGNVVKNIVSVWAPAEINTNPTITTDPLMAMSNESMGAGDAVLGNDSEFIISTF